MSWSLKAAMAAMQLATQEELDAAMQTRPELRSRVSNAAQPSSAASSSGAAPAPAQQGLQPVVLPSFGGLPPQIGVMPVGGPGIRRMPDGRSGASKHSTLARHRTAIIIACPATATTQFGTWPMTGVQGTSVASVAETESSDATHRAGTTPEIAYHIPD